MENSKTFDQSKYINEWAKKNMGHINVQYKRDFVDEFKEACKTLNIKQSQVFREAMEKTIEEAKKQGKQ